MTADQTADELSRTPLYDVHVELGARLVPFGGFLMPVQYPSGIRAEHRTVREAAGMFDVSHMGEFRVRGPEATSFVSHATTNDPAGMDAGRQAQYSVMCYEDGGIVDDLVVYRLARQEYRLVVNAANIARDLEHLQGLAGEFDVEIEDESDEVALLAVQGPRAEAVVAPLTDLELEGVGFYRFDRGPVAGVEAVVSRTGYTGEDGFELYVAADEAPGLWWRLLEEGESEGLEPAGLGARDTLRLEMGYALYDHDIDADTTPLEARLGWLVKLEKGDFLGRDALRRQEEEGVDRRLTGFRLTERGFPREGYPVLYRGEPAAEVRSGTVSPTLGYGIGTAYLPPEAEPGDPLAVVIRDEEISGQVEKMPFYRDGSLKR